jgi:hypothetical protein
VKPYDRSWDEGVDADVFERKCEEWERRDWASWLNANLSFPFEVKREEDMAHDWVEPDDGPFSVGRRMTVTGLAEEDFSMGFLVWVKSGTKTERIPLSEVEVTSNQHINYWPVREYAVWMANH